MTQTGQMLRAINAFLVELGDPEITVPTSGKPIPELVHLRQVREEYKRRLIMKVPRYRGLPETMIPDLFLSALQKREAELSRQETRASDRAESDA